MCNSKNSWRLPMAVNPASGSSQIYYLVSRFSHHHLMGLSNFTEKINKLLELWPGEKTLGPYRFLPVFFAAGAALEYAMVNWRPNGVNFYDSFRAKQAKKLALSKWKKWKEIEANYK